MDQRAPPTSVRWRPPKIRASRSRNVTSCTVGSVTRVNATMPWWVTRPGGADFHVTITRPIISVIPWPPLLMGIPSAARFIGMVQSAVWSAPSRPTSFICILWNWCIYSWKFNTHFPLGLKILCFKNFSILLLVLHFFICIYCDPWWLLLFFRIWKNVHQRY